MPNFWRFAAATVIVAVLAVAGLAPTPAAVQPIVTAINVRGNSHVPTDKIAAVIRSQAGVPLDMKKVAADQQSILGLGYFTDVKTDVHATPGGVAVSFIVIENPTVSKIAFTGNKQVSNDILNALMDTTAGQVLNTNTLRDDVQKINSYYDKLGYIGTRHVQDIRIDANGTVNIAVKEGVTVTKVVVTGNQIIPEPAILATMKTKEGTVFSGQVFNEDLNAISTLYKDAGFSAVVDGSPDPNKPGYVNVTICEARIGAIEIAGNGVTKDYVIRRLLRLHPGDLVSDSRLRRDYENIYNTQFFKSVDLSTKPFGNKCGYLTLVWTVVEQRTGNAGVNVSYGGGGTYGQGFGGGVSFSQNNVAGTGNSASISLQRGQHFSDVNLSVSVPYIKKFKPDSVSFSIFNNLISNQPRPVYKAAGNNPFYVLSPSSGNAVLGNFATPPPGTVGTFACTANGSPCAAQFANYSSRQAGVQLGFGHPVAEFTRFNIGVSATRLFQAISANGFPQQFLNIQSGLLSPNQIGTPSTGGAAQPGTSNLRSLTLGIFRDDRDDIQNPRFGGTSGFSEELSTRAFGSDFTFGKGDFDYTRFLPVRHHSSLAMHFNYGFSSGGTRLPYNDLFSLSEQQLRGTRFLYYGDRELLGQVELRIPVTSDKKFGIALFADAGDAPYITPVVGPTPGPTPVPPAGPHSPPFPALQPAVNYVEAPFHLKSDIGFGIRVQTPILPQVIRIDIATGQQGTHTS
ncbi:MAG: BamA/TamA family outer membrane protein, partial [Candidatus Eremiobacteraeota bacterium]|nr:BamA/TamA family outer membrane protein [Candidatus Eremiobacteraeota bacterium]